MQKYNKFQDMLTEIISPELMEIMESMQQLSQELDLNQLLEQLDSSIEHGCHVFVEKPISSTIEEADEGIATAEVNNLKFTMFKGYYDKG